MSPILTPGMGGHGMDAAPQAIHYAMPKERTPRSEEPFAPFNGRTEKLNKKGRDPRNMAVFQSSPANVGGTETARELPPRKEAPRELSFERPALPDVPGRITERISGRAREASRFPEKTEEPLRMGGSQKRHANPTRAHTKNLLEKKIVRALDKKYTEEGYPEGEIREYPTPEELERAVLKEARAVLTRTMPANNPVRKASKELSGRSFGDGVTHGTILKKLLSTAFGRADEAKSREKEGRNEVRGLKEGTFAAQFLETEEDLRAEAALLAEEGLLRKEKQKSAELLSLYPEAHDSEAQPDDPNDLLNRYPEARDPDEYLRRLRIRESREAILSVLGQHAEDAAQVEKIPRVQTGNGGLNDMAAKNKRLSRDERRAIIKRKTGEDMPSETLFPNPQVQAFPDYMTQQ